MIDNRCKCKQVSEVLDIEYVSSISLAPFLLIYPKLAELTYVAMNVEAANNFFGARR
ncbi:hypothetical protein WG66_013285 [Moniliophthora roreri]|nr:hypothetical protein WG66_013285 [Moniliophthora roreri]